MLRSETDLNGRLMGFPSRLCKYVASRRVRFVPGASRIGAMLFRMYSLKQTHFGGSRSLSRRLSGRDVRFQETGALSYTVNLDALAPVRRAHQTSGHERWVGQRLAVVNSV